MRIDLPPAGKPMRFPEWSSAVVAAVRAFIPQVAASRKGDRTVVLRYEGRVATLIDDHDFWIRFGDGAGVPMASLFDAERRDDFTTKNFGRSIAGYFDGKFSVG